MPTFGSTVFGILVRFVQFGNFLAPWLRFIFLLQLKDLYYLALNTLKRERPVGQVISLGNPGYRGHWPKYKAPDPSHDSRSPCPALNALANHGILPRDGKRVTYDQLSQAIQHAYNLAPSLGNQLTAPSLLLDQGRGWINLEDLSAMNLIQHDASFTRPDIAHYPDQSHSHPKLVNKFLASASDSKRLSLDDISYYSGVRRAECKNTNGQYTLTWSFLHQFFGSGNGALMYSVFGGIVEDLRTWLVEERFPEGWEPKNREALGHTIFQAQVTSLAIEFNIRENQNLRPASSTVLN